MEPYGTPYRPPGTIAAAAAARQQSMETSEGLLAPAFTLGPYPNPSVVISVITRNTIFFAGRISRSKCISDA